MSSRPVLYTSLIVFMMVCAGNIPFIWAGRVKNWIPDLLVSE